VAYSQMHLLTLRLHSFLMRRRPDMWFRVNDIQRAERRNSAVVIPRRFRKIVVKGVGKDQMVPKR
jgi:hypothetical protein